MAKATKELTALVQVRVTEAMKTLVEKAAAAEQRTVSSFVMAAMIERLRARGYVDAEGKPKGKKR
jgi:uncharacterized protein (DUF1778 family)